MPDRTALPQTLLGYILQVSRRHQLALWGLSVVVFLLSAAPLEIQRRIVNDAIRTGSIDAVALLALAYFGLALAEGAVKLCLNVYRAWVSERAVLDLRHAVSALALTAVPGTDRADAEGKEISMMLSEVEPIGGFVGISISEPLLQMGILGSVFGYLMYLEPLMAVLCVMALAPQMLFVPMMQRAINRRAAERIETLRRVGGDIVGPQAGGMAATDQQARLQHTAALTQVLHLTLAQRDGLATVRVGQLDVRQQCRIVFEKQGVAAQPGRYIIGVHQARSLHGKPLLPARSW